MFTLKYDDDIVQVKCDICHRVLTVIHNTGFELRAGIPNPSLCPDCLERIWRNYEDYFRVHFSTDDGDKNAKPTEEKTCEERVAELERRVDFLMKARAEELADRIYQCSERTI